VGKKEQLMKIDKEQIKREMEGPVLTPLKAMRVYCIDCCGGSRNEVKLCPSKDCSLWPYRFGKNPYNTRVVSEEQRKMTAERLNAARKAKASANLRSE
jgi:hypothetical protein